MRDMTYIKMDRRIQVKDSGIDGMNGWVTLKGKTFFFVCSNGGGWDHVSVSSKSRCPSWDEMCEIKNIFFMKHECCVEYHPAEEDYVNVHHYCLHIWKPQKVELPKPPKWFV